MKSSLFAKHQEVVQSKAAEITQELFKKSIESVGRITLKKQEGIKYSIGEISNWVTKLILLLHDLDAAREAFRLHGYVEGGLEKYTGLTGKDSNKIEKFKNEITKAKVFEVSYELDRKCIAEFQICKWSDKNVKKFLLDMIMIGRLYQEKTIDYAKKISVLEIQESPMKRVKAMSLQKMEVSFKDGTVEIDVAEPKGKNVVILNDLIHQTRMEFAEEYQRFVSEILMPQINKAELPEIVAEELKMLKTSSELYPFVDMKTYYKDIVGGFFNARQIAEENEEEEVVSVAQEQFKEDKARISNMLRMATAYMTPETRGAYMKYISGRTKNNQVSEHENRFYLSVCKEEFVAWLISMGLAEVPFAGYKLIANKGYEVGEFVQFWNGIADKAILDGRFSGWAEIKEFDGKLYAAVELEDLVKAPAVDNRVIMKVQQSFVTKHGADEVIKALNLAKDCAFVADASKKRFALEIDCMDGKKRDVPYDLNGWFFKILAGHAGTIVNVAKNTIRDMNGIEVDSVYVSIDLNEIPEVKEAIKVEKAVKPSMATTVVEESEGV